MIRPSVAIIIVTYNSAATIRSCLSSVLATMCQSDAILVVDNNSRDATVELVSSFASPLVTIISNPDTKGFSVATNQGLAATSAPFIVLLNPDTIVTPDWLERLFAHFTVSGVAAVGPVSNFTAGRQSVLLHWRGSMPESVTPCDAAELLYGWNHGTGESTRLLIGFCMMLRRDVVEQLGGLDERLFLGNDDLELSWRLRSHGYELRIATDVFIYHEGQHSFRGEPESLTERLVRDSSSALYRILEEQYGSGRVPPPQAVWGIDWFYPPCGVFNARIQPHQILTPPRSALAAPEGRPLVSIIILTFNQRHYTEECLAALERHTPEPYEVIIVDNGSHDGTVTWLESVAAGNQHYRLIINSGNRGFAAGCNQGLAAARGEFLLLLNNDVVVTPEWLSGLIECYRAEPHVGIVGPLTNNASGIQVLQHVAYSDLDGLSSFAGTFRSNNRYRRVPSRRLVGFCMLFSRQLYQEIGGLDEGFGTGNFEDDDFCLRAAVAGYRNLIAGDVYVHHHGSVSFKGANMDYRAALTGNWAVFHEKWSRPVSDKEAAGRIASCRAREDAERLLQEGRTGEAVTLLERACREYGEDRLLRLLLSHALQEAGRFDEALPLLSAESAPALTIRARRLLAAGENDEAEALLVSAIVTDPGYGTAYLLRGDIALRCGEEEYATALVLKGFLLSPALSEHARAAEKLIDGPQVSYLASIVAEAVQLNPYNRTLARLLVEIAQRSGDERAVLDAAERYINGFGLDEHVLDLGVAARRTLGPWHPVTSEGRAVSLCMIVRDEERHIVRCLASCRPLVHEMVVVDTGSHDHTAQLAELMGARVIHHPWREDFADARNVSVDAATGDWILVMDGDEVLSSRDYANFNRILHEASSRDAFVITTRNYTTHTALEGFVPLDSAYPDEEAGTGWTPSTKVRLFPNRLGIRFEGVVHEMVEGMVARAGLTVHEHPVPVHHYGGLEEERLERKRSLYYALGQRKLKAGVNDPKALYELAVQAGELEHFTEAEEYWQALLEQEPDIPVAWFNLSYIYLKTGRPEAAVRAAERAVVLKPEYQAALVNLALGRFCLLPPPDALKALENIRAEDLSIQVLRNVALCLNNRLDEGVAGLRNLAASGYDFADFLKSTAALLCSSGRQEEGRVLEALAGILG